MSRSSNKIVDLSERATIYTPQRSIPKASRQIRGISNLLMSSDPTPTVYPEPLQRWNFSTDQLFQQAEQKQKQIAQKRGLWLELLWQKDDLSGESIMDKIAFMTILTMKHGVSFLQVWPDEQDEEIKTQVFDAFDISVLGDYTNIYDCPFIIKSIPMPIARIRGNELFDKDQRDALTPDNRKASSEIKEAYMQSRFGRDTTSDQAATIILNEAFIKEFITDKVVDRIRRQEDGEDILKLFSVKGEIEYGKPIIRQVFTAGGEWLFDHYTNLSEYPFVDYRMEPGPIYQVPMIERFMPANKSLDSVISRVERYTHTMVTGSWLKRRGEQFKLNNIAGGQVVEYDATPPTQNQIAPIPPFVYEFINLLHGYIEEQGVTTSTIGKIPNGVTANAAIESLKESEYANLVIATRRLNSTLKKLARKCLEIADESFITPQNITGKIEGKVVNFNVIGARAARERKKLKIETPGEIITLDKNTPVDIEIEQGMAYTKEGQRTTMQTVMKTMIELLQAGAISPQSLQIVAKRYLETYQFGSTEEFMDSLDENMPNITQQQMTMMKMALLQALQEAEEIGPKGDQAKVQAAQLGTLKALKDTGMIKNLGQTPTKPLSESLNVAYKDLPEDSKRIVEQQIGLRSPLDNGQGVVSPQGAKIVTDAAMKQAQMLHEMQLQQMEQQQSQQNEGNQQTTQNEK